MTGAHRHSFIPAMATAYDEAATAWSLGASVVYERLADEVVALMPRSTGGTVLDLCAGTGAATTALLRRHQPVIAVDVSHAMLAVGSHARPPGVAADALALPFRAAAFAGVIVNCGLNHAPDPVAFLREAGRVTQPGGAVLASTFTGGWAHPAKAAVDGALMTFGYRAPSWHQQFKSEIEPASSAPEQLIALSERAGLAERSVTRLDVVVDLSIEQMVAWRFAMASHAAFVSGLSEDARRRVTQLATTAVRDCWEPLVIPLLVFSGTA